MESTQLLDILGNGNRRKILGLLASRPYYVSEISDRINVGPKAVLQHLGLLEEIGLIRADTNEQRRKYYHIAENVKLEVFVSPHSYTVEASTIIQNPQPGKTPESRQHPIDDSESISDLKKLNRDLLESESKRRKLAAQQRKVEGEMSDILDRCVERIHEVAHNYLEAEILLHVLKEPQDWRALSMNLKLPEYYIEEHINSLIERGIITEVTIKDRQILSLV